MTLDSTLFFGALVALALAFALRAFHRDRQARERRLVRDSIVSFFQKSGSFVTVSCFSAAEGLVALVEAEAHKKFRFSHLKERTLAEHVAKTTGKQIERVYWRFRIRSGTVLPKDYEPYEAPAPVAPFPSPSELGRAMAKDIEGFVADENRVNSLQQAIWAKANRGEDPDLPPAKSA